MTPKAAIRSAVYLLVLALLAWAAWRWWPELSATWQGHAPTFIGTIILVCGSIALQASTFRLFLPPDKRPSVRDTARIWAVAGLVNYLGPLQPGLLARVAMLNRYGVDTAVATVATFRQITASVWIATGATGAALLSMGGETSRLIGLGCVVAFIALPLSLRLVRHCVAAVVRGRRSPVLGGHLAEALRLPAPGAVVGVLAMYGWGAVILMYAYSEFGADIGVAAAALVACGVYVSSLVALLPGNLGVSETIYVVGGHRLGLGVSEAAALALLLRASHVVACVLVAAATHRWRGSPHLSVK